jgi:hypothetical protein
MSCELPFRSRHGASNCDRVGAQRRAAAVDRSPPAVESRPRPALSLLIVLVANRAIDPDHNRLKAPVSAIFQGGKPLLFPILLISPPQSLTLVQLGFQRIQPRLEAVNLDSPAQLAQQLRPCERLVRLHLAGGVYQRLRLRRN